MISVKAKSQLTAHKSNILLAFLALTDLMVGILFQPTFAGVLIMLLLDEPRGYCVLQVLRSGPARGFGYTVSRGILIQVYGILWSKFGYKVFSFS